MQEKNENEIKMEIPVPIFVIVKDRLTCLKQSIKSWINLIKTPVEIIFIDNGSTYQPTIDFLKKVEKAYPDKVYWKKPKHINKNHFCKSVSNSISDYMPKSKSKYYIVSDPDIMFEKVPDDILEFFIFLLNKTKVTCVGPSLKINDIPDHYPLKTNAIKRQQGLWEKPINKIEHKGAIVKYKRCRIDTTFAVYRKGFNFDRHNNGIRVFEPYIAKHLDWYIDPKNMPKDQIYYMKDSNSHHGISHWCGQQFERAVYNQNKTKK